MNAQDDAMPPLDSPVVDQWYAELDARSAVGGRSTRTPESVLVAGEAAVAELNRRRGRP